MKFNHALNRAIAQRDFWLYNHEYALVQGCIANSEHCYTQYQYWCNRIDDIIGTQSHSIAANFAGCYADVVAAILAAYISEHKIVNPFNVCECV